MGGFGGGRDSGDDGNTNRERGAAAARSRATPKSKSTNSTSDFVNSKTPPNALAKYTPASMQILGTILDSVTGATKKNKEFMVNNYNRIGKNYNLPDRKVFDQMSTEEKNKTYSEMRSTFQRNNLDPFGESIGGGNGKDNNAQGIELAKSATGSATILGPGEIQKQASNNISGPTTAEMSADQIALANKRKGRRSTNVTAKTTLANNYTLSKKTLLG